MNKGKSLLPLHLQQQHWQTTHVSTSLVQRQHVPEFRISNKSEEIKHTSGVQMCKVFFTVAECAGIKLWYLSAAFVFWCGASKRVAIVEQESLGYAICSCGSLRNNSSLISCKEAPEYFTEVWDLDLSTAKPFASMISQVIGIISGKSSTTEGRPCLG